jgi:hypothetical protein
VGAGPFADAALEREYRLDYFSRSLNPVRAAILLALGLFIGFAALDGRVMPDAREDMMVVRFGFVVPLLVVVLGLGRSRTSRWPFGQT